MKQGTFSNNAIKLFLDLIILVGKISYNRLLERAEHIYAR